MSVSTLDRVSIASAEPRKIAEAAEGAGKSTTQGPQRRRGTRREAATRDPRFARHESRKSRAQTATRFTGACDRPFRDPCGRRYAGSHAWQLSAALGSPAFSALDLLPAHSVSSALRSGHLP